MQTIGERLEDARKKKGVSIREAADLTKIRGEYLQKFESNQFDIGLSEIYVRGFLRNYAHFLHVPAERLLNDYGALVRKESRPRSPSREVYGRMDVSVSSADAAEAAAPEAHAHPHTPGTGPGRPPARFPRPGLSLPKAPTFDPAVVLRVGKWAAAVVVAVLLIWGAKALFSGSSPARPHAEPVAAAPAGTAEAAAPVTLIALAPLQVKVARQADGQELYQGPMARNERREFPNVGLWITSYTVESLRVEYKGALYEFPGQKGHARVPLPPFSAKP
jgi:transcriptional regulator with XRE-family HTH domain